MKIVWAFGWLPILVVKSKPPNDFRGYTRIFTVLVVPVTWVQIHPEFWDDKHILAHELQHVEDYLRQPWTYYFRYQTPEGRLKFEVRAYARQYLSYKEPGTLTLARFVELILDRSKYKFEYDRADVIFRLQRAIDSMRLQYSQ